MAWKTHKADKADRYFSLYVRYRDSWRCQRCHRQYLPPTNSLHAAHFVGRAKENTRYLLDNCISLCLHDHQYFHGHPAEFVEWFTQKYGQEKVDEIRLASSFYCKKDRKAQALLWKQKLKDDFGINASG